MKTGRGGLRDNRRVQKGERGGLDAAEVALFTAMCGVLLIAAIVLWPAAVTEAKRLAGMGG